MFGALLAASLPTDFLRVLLPIMLIAIASYFAFKPALDDLDREKRIGTVAFGLSAAPVIGFYDRVFGPGAGSFYMIAFVALAGMGMLRATAHTKLLNFASNVGGFAVFAASGVVDWRIGLSMGAAQVVGAWLGARTAMRAGSRLIKPLLVTVCLVLAVRVLLDETNPVRAWIASLG